MSKRKKRKLKTNIKYRNLNLSKRYKKNKQRVGDRAAVVNTMITICEHMVNKQVKIISQDVDMT